MIEGIQFLGAVEHQAGALRLDGFPLLAHSPAQWGEGICTEDNGSSVDAIASAFRATPDFPAIAAQFGTTEKHVRQAVAYLIVHGV